jgi:hypothetical protein
VKQQASSCSLSGGGGEAQAGAVANAFASALLLEMVGCEGNEKDYASKANVNLPYQYAHRCWTQPYHPSFVTHIYRPMSSMQ